MKIAIRMSNRACFALSILLSATLLLAACGPAATTATPTPAALPDGSAIKVGLVTGAGGVNDHAFNQLAWEGVQKAAQDMGFQVKLLESEQPTDYATNIAALAAQGYNVIITAGSLLSDATAWGATQHPEIKFAIIDHAYAPPAGDLSNVTSLMFAEEQAGFLAGVLAGGMSRSGFVCSVSSMRTAASDRYVISFHAGASWQAGPELKIMNNYINLQTADETADENVPSFVDATQGKETALRLIGAGCDVLFAVGGDAVSGVLLAASENNLPAIGADVDGYNSDPERQPALISSARKNADVAVYNYLRTVADGSVRGGISTATLQNGGVGLAPFRDWESKIPADLKARIQQATSGIEDGSIQIDLPAAE